MLKLNYFLADIFILSAEKQPIKLSWRKIEWLLYVNANICDIKQHYPDAFYNPAIIRLYRLKEFVEGVAE